MLLTICIIGITVAFGSTLAYFMCCSPQGNDTAMDKYMDKIEERMTNDLFTEK